MLKIILGIVCAKYFLFTRVIVEKMTPLEENDARS